MSDELSAALRELAADRATAPIVGGPATRARAVRRRRRRRAAATLGAGTAALALLGVALTLRLGEDPAPSSGHRTPAAAAPSASATAPVATATPTPMALSGTLDLPARALTFAGQVMPILSTFDLSAPDLASGSTGATLMTVVAKPVRLELAADVPPKGRTVVNVAHAVELRDGKGSRLYVGTFATSIKAHGYYDARGGVIALGAAEARWFHNRVHPGDSIVVTTGIQPAPEASQTRGDQSR
ncbi:hypothetical protein B6E66_07750 [Streptomyces maremycinicus]|nr:hypothetical protein B6E66_07750 [Streptomyces sp. B9173]